MSDTALQGKEVDPAKVKFSSGQATSSSREAWGESPLPPAAGCPWPRTGTGLERAPGPPRLLLS